MKQTSTLPVSVILPTHNRTEVLPRAIRSVLAQTCSPAELIVVDDASTEDVKSVIDAFNDSRLRYLRLNENVGAGAARNIGVQAASQEWIAFQDSDDEWLISKLEIQWRMAEFGEIDAALICGAYLVAKRNGNNLLVAPNQAMMQPKWSPSAKFTFPFIAPTWLLRRSVFLEMGGFNAELPNLEDWELALRLHKRGTCVVTTEPLLLKHGSADGLNQQLAYRQESLRQVAADHADFFAQNPDLRAAIGRQIARAAARMGATESLREAAASTYRAAPSIANLILLLAVRLPRKAFLAIERRTRPRTQSLP